MPDPTDASNRSDDARWMREALALARRARPSPNPRVGCVLVRDGVCVGQGFHRAAGGPHAEAHALEVAGERARGATAYVTLEPCNHHGRTPPCSEALLRAGVARVVVGVEDPNPHVAGGGVARLRTAGVTVDVATAEVPACRDLVRAWQHAVVHATPYVTLKVGMSLDGRIATHTGASRWITGPDARADAHRARADNDAVLVGVGTVLADDPRLTARIDGHTLTQPLRVVVDTHARTPAGSALFATITEGPVCIVHGPDADAGRLAALHDAGAQTIAVSLGADGRIDLHAALERLYERGVVSVLVEGGASVHGALLDAQLAHALCAYVAPVLLGGRGALSAIGGVGAETPDRAARLRELDVRRLGDDLRITAEINHVHRDRDRRR